MQLSKPKMEAQKEPASEKEYDKAVSSHQYCLTYTLNS